MEWRVHTLIFLSCAFFIVQQSFTVPPSREDLIFLEQNKLPDLVQRHLDEIFAVKGRELSEKLGTAEAEDMLIERGFTILKGKRVGGDVKLKLEAQKVPWINNSVVASFYCPHNGKKYVLKMSANKPRECECDNLMRIKITRLIEQQCVREHLVYVAVPSTYVYHIPETPPDLDDRYYVVVSEWVERNASLHGMSFHRLAAGNVSEDMLCNIIEVMCKQGYFDIWHENVLFGCDGRAYFIDNEDVGMLLVTSNYTRLLPSSLICEQKHRISWEEMYGNCLLAFFHAAKRTPRNRWLLENMKTKSVTILRKIYLLTEGLFYLCINLEEGRVKNLVRIKATAIYREVVDLVEEMKSEMRVICNDVAVKKFFEDWVAGERERAQVSEAHVPPIENERQEEQEELPEEKQLVPLRELLPQQMLLL